MQAQGNLAEYIGIFVVMLAVLELNGASEGAVIEIEGAEAVWRVGNAWGGWYWHRLGPCKNAMTEQWALAAGRRLSAAAPVSLFHQNNQEACSRTCCL